MEICKKKEPLLTGRTASVKRKEPILKGKVSGRSNESMMEKREPIMIKKESQCMEEITHYRRRKKRARGEDSF